MQNLKVNATCLLQAGETKELRYEMNNPNQVQQSYLVAKALFETLQHQKERMEQAYIELNGIRNRDGSIPRNSWSIDDEALCEKAMAECTKIIEDSGLWVQILEARSKLLQTENELLEYGVNLMPQRVKAIFEKAVKQNLAIRGKVIDLTLKLDVYNNFR